MKPIISSSYSIFFNQDGYNELSLTVSKNNYSKVFLLVDENTEKHCLPNLDKKVDFSFQIIKIKSGEHYKNLDTCNEVWKFLNNNADRKSLLINLGGGVITDMGGFIASTFKRGIDFINIPTTLLSIVDASVGSKTGINFNSLKNQIGVFSDPILIIIDTEYLKTLDERNIKSGYGEIFKHSLISGNLFEKLINNSNKLYNDKIIYNSINVKNNIVLRDRKEENIRKYLNFGHTIGHAIESIKLNSNSKIFHGEAVIAGIIIELYLSYKVLNFPIDIVRNVKEHLENIFEKIYISSNEIKDLFKLLQFDKKNYLNKVNFVLLENIGNCKVDINVENEIIIEAIDFYNS